MKKKEKEKKEVFIALTKGHLLGSKIHYFVATFHKKDYLVIEQLFKEIKKEMP